MDLFVRSEDESNNLSIVLMIMPAWRLSLYFQIATVVVLVYDAFITLDKEAKYFWKIPRKSVDFVYFANRYGGIIGAVTTMLWSALSATQFRCVFNAWVTTIAECVTTISIEYILVIRVLALYAQDRRMAICLKTLLVLTAIAKIVLTVYVNIFQHYIAGDFGPMALCGISTILPWETGIGDWLIPMSFGVILMVLALYKAAEYWKLSAGLKGFTLVKVLILDQALYFMLVIASSVFIVLTNKLYFPNLFLSNVFSNLGNPAFLSLLGNRMMFNLKEAGERGVNEGTSYKMPSRIVSEMNFAIPVDVQRVDGSKGAESTEVA